MRISALLIHIDKISREFKNEAQTALQSTKSFYKEYVSGMNRQRFNKDFRSDSERLKQLYKEAVEDIEREQGRRYPVFNVS